MDIIFLADHSPFHFGSYRSFIDTSIVVNRTRINRKICIFACVTTALLGINACAGNTPKHPVPVASPAPQKPSVTKVYPVEQPGEFVGEALEDISLSGGTVNPGSGDQRFLLGKLANGGSLYVTDFVGKVLVVNYWTSRCASCWEAFEHLEHMRREYADRNVEIIAVNRGETPSVITDFLQRQPSPINYTIVSDRFEEASRALGVTILPTTLVFDIDGTVYRRYTGTAGFDVRRLRDDINRILDGRV